MVQKYPGLIVKGRAFYFRVGVPRKYWTLAKCKEICYTLDTSDYKLAVARWRTEIAHLQTFLNVYKNTKNFTKIQTKMFVKKFCL